MIQIVYSKYGYLDYIDILLLQVMHKISQKRHAASSSNI